ncbi:hypothetical protein ACQEVF_57205 [Nonomuraea polychroma]|uniref:hypothetical protein n=1 Tax=Nonomuraea polychroma TaxID=46176 RepID=UPI003D8C3746
MEIPHSGDRPPPYCGLGHSDHVPYVEALAFWGRAVEHGHVPRSYALGVLCDHAFLHMTDLYGRGEPPTRWERLWAAAEDLADWENIVMEMSLDGGDFFDYLRQEQKLRDRLAQLPIKIAFCEERLEADQAERHTSGDDPSSASP